MFTGQITPTEFDPVIIQEGEVLERFGCMRALDSSMYDDIIDSVDDTVDIEEESALEVSDEFINRYVSLPGVLDDEDDDVSGEIIATQEPTPQQKVAISPIPLPFQTKEEVNLFSEVLNEIDQRGQRVTYVRIATEFNRKIIEKVI
jgi:hypothetical protein